jgi:hypothetical protein
MIYYFIILFFIIISISSQQIDEIVECNQKNLTDYQFDKMNLDEQEQLVNKVLFYFKNSLTVLNDVIRPIITESDLE